MIEIENNLEKEEYDLNAQMSKFKDKTGQDFLTFYKKFFPKLIFHNTKFVNDVAIAEDIAMDSMMKALEKVDSYNPEKAGFSTWLFTISRNDCLHHNSKKVEISIDRVVDEDGTTIKEFLPDGSIEEEYYNDIKELQIKKAELLKEKINELKNPYRNVIKLRELDKKSYREITIILREKDNLQVDNHFFDREHYEKNVLSLVDPEKKQDNELVKFYKINNIEDRYGNNIDFKIVERDKDGLISKIELPKGDYIIDGEVPFNMSTLKSQIRNGRKILKDMVENDFAYLDSVYM